MEDNKKTIKIILDLIKKFPNDYDLGKKIREKFRGEEKIKK